MRTRTRSTSFGVAAVGPFAIRHTHNEYGSLSSSDGTISAKPSLSLGSFSEVITDDTTRSSVTKNVTHDTSRFERIYQSSTGYAETADTGLGYGYPADQITDTYGVLADPGGYPGQNYHWYSWGHYGEIPSSAIQTSYSKSTQDLLRSAMKKVLMVNEVDNLLNVLESPQLISSLTAMNRSLAKTIDTNTARAKKAARSITSKNRNMTVVLKEGLRGYGGEILRNLKSSPSAFLAYSFGIAPVLADISKVSNAVKDLKKATDRYVRDFEKPFTATAAVSGTIKVDPTYSGTGYYPISGTRPSNKWWTTRLVANGAPVKLVGVKARRNIHYKSEAFKKLQYFLDRFVSNGPASFVWERIPYSFVVDWFVDLSNVVGALDNLLSGDRITYIDGWQSERWSCTCPIQFSPYSPWKVPSLGDSPITAVNEFHHYHREYLDPHIVVGLSDRFGKKQALLSGALLYQMVANLRRKSAG